MKNHTSSNTKIGGLKRAIKNYKEKCRNGGPQHSCKNCHCVRYVECGCSKKKGNENE